MKRSRVLVLVAVAAVVLAVALLTADDDRPGSAEVYADIASATDCAELRQGLTRNQADVARRYPRRSIDPMYDVVRSYADAYEERMQEVC